MTLRRAGTSNMGKSYFDQFDTVPTEPIAGEGEAPAEPWTFLDWEKSAQQEPRPTGGTEVAPLGDLSARPAKSTGNFFDQFNVPPAVSSLPDWMRNPAPASWRDVTQLIGIAPSGGNVAPPTGGSSNRVPMEIPFDGGGFDSFGAPASSISPAAMPQQSLPRAADPSTPPLVPTPQPYSGPAMQWSPAKRNVGRSQAMANPPLPSSLPAPAPLPTPEGPDDAYKAQVAGNFGVMKLLQANNAYVRACLKSAGGRAKAGGAGWQGEPSAHPP